MRNRVCFLGGARYSQLLDTTSEKKFRSMKSLGEIFVIGFSGELGPRWFTEHAKFYLLPTLPFAPFRYAEMLLLGVPLAFWVIARHGVQALVAQSPYEGFAAGGLPDIVRPQETGWIAEIVLPVALADAVEAALNDVRHGKDLRSSCRAVAEAEFGLDLQADRYLNLFLALLNTQASASFRKRMAMR